MALALTVVDHWFDLKRLHVIAGLVASGSYASGGDTVPVSDPLIKSSQAPVWADALGYSAVYEYLPVMVAGALALKVVTRSTGTELAAGAYPVGVTGDTIGMHIIFPKF